MPKPPSLYKFNSEDGSFSVSDPRRFSQLYFPLVNEAGLLSAITPDLQGDIKLDQHSFLTLPVSVEDLHLSRSSRNFWLTLTRTGKRVNWSVVGRSGWQRSNPASESVSLDAGFLWHEVRRRNASLGLEAKILNFVPPSAQTFEIMYVEIKNISKKPITFTATSAIPLYGRSADNLRDHRHVTSLLNRVSSVSHGLELRPTMSFNERGHRINETVYYVIGSNEKNQAPKGLFPTVASFVGEGGDLEMPAALEEGWKAPGVKEGHQGKEAMGALQFAPTRLAPGKSAGFTLLLGIAPYDPAYPELIKKYLGKENVEKALAQTKESWEKKLSKVRFKTGDENFNQWARWVSAQPTFRKIFGCSFLPDFDYGRGGRGWRDLWQDCLALLLSNPEAVRSEMVKNFGGVRIDGSNATVIARKAIPNQNGSAASGEDPKNWEVEFIADRNNIVRTWMDHGVWPYLTSHLYLNQTGDWSFLLEEVPYFRDGQFFRGRRQDFSQISGDASTLKLKTKAGKIYTGTILEHILVQTLVQFFNVGEHNNIRLEDADWNDGLDMAHERGESVAFSSLYAGNLSSLADLLEAAEKRAGWKHVNVAEELGFLLDRISARVDYESVAEKTARLKTYFEVTAVGVSGQKTSVPIAVLVSDLREKAAWLKDHINKNEWLEHKGLGWYNGYYDNKSRRVEGVDGKSVRMTLTGQVFPIMAGLPSPERTRQITKAVDTYLCDPKVKGIRLNTDFGGIQPDLGRAFSFAYGEKENGAVFSHMVVMYANALYQHGFVAEGHRALQSLYELAAGNLSKIYPGLPEYFNGERRGRYHFLTGSASWYVLTLLTQVFGVRGLWGDLLISPKLEPDQFDKKGFASVTAPFAGARLSIVYSNPRRVSFQQMKILSVRDPNGTDIPLASRSDHEVVISRRVLQRQPEWEIYVELGSAGDR